MPRMSSKMCQPMSPRQADKFREELLRVFGLLPKVSADFGVPQPKVDFTFTGKRNGHYTWLTNTIQISPKPWHGSPLTLFIHEFAHHIQNMEGRCTGEFLRENKDWTSDGGHGWSFFEILCLVVDHFWFTYGIPYDWTTEYDHIKMFRRIMTQDSNFIPDSQLKATMSLFCEDEPTARKRILHIRCAHVS